MGKAIVEMVELMYQKNTQKNFYDGLMDELNKARNGVEYQALHIGEINMALETIRRVFRFISILIYFTIFNSKMTTILILGLLKSIRMSGEFKSKINFTYLIMSGCYVMTNTKDLKLKVVT